MKLYEVCEQLKNLVQYDDERYLDEDTGELFTAEDIDALEIAKDEKIKNIIWLIKNLDSDAKALKEEKAKFEARRKAAENIAERLREYLKRTLGSLVTPDNKKWTYGVNSVSFRMDKDVKLVGDIKQVPSEFLKYEEPTLRRTDAKKALMRGEKVDGCTLEDKLIMTIR